MCLAPHQQHCPTNTVHLNQLLIGKVTEMFAVRLKQWISLKKHLVGRQVFLGGRHSRAEENIEMLSTKNTPRRSGQIYVTPHLHFEALWGLDPSVEVIRTACRHYNMRHDNVFPSLQHAARG